MLLNIFVTLFLVNINYLVTIFFCKKKTVNIFDFFPFLLLNFFLSQNRILYY